jgi:hypothetical protein
MKKLVILLLAILFTVPAMADGEQKQYDKVVLKLTDGRVYDIDIDKESYVYSYTKEVEGVLVQFVEISGKNEIYLFERGELSSMRFVESISTYIKDLQEDIDNNPIRFVDGKLVFSDEMVGETYYLYDVAGKILFQGVVKSNLPVVLDKLPNGFYVAEVNRYKLKLMVQ